MLTTEQHHAVASPQSPRGPLHHRLHSDFLSSSHLLWFSPLSTYAYTYMWTLYSRMTMCSIRHGPLYIANPVGFSKYIPLSACLPSDGFPTLVCVGRTGESSNSLTLQQNHLYAVRHDTLMRFIRPLR